MAKKRDMFVTMGDECCTDVLTSGDTVHFSLKEAMSQATDDLTNYDDGCCHNDPTVRTIYKLVPVKRLRRPTEVIEENL